MAKKTAESTLPREEIEAIVGGYHSSPFSTLGMHRVTHNGDTRIAVRAFRPLEKEIDVLETGTDNRYPMKRLHKEGFFEAVIPGRDQPFSYTLGLIGRDGGQYEIEDPYRFPATVTDYEIYLHSEGNLFKSYEKLGAHPVVRDGVPGVQFAVWAPNALRIGLIGPFNGWDNRAHPMQAVGGGIWELFLPRIPVGTDYKYAIKSAQRGYEVDKADPYAFFADVRPGTASRVWDLASYQWNDDDWIQSRPHRHALNQPISVYEVHLGSWRRVPETGGNLTYIDLAHQLVDHVRELGFTHIELLPITEHPFDGSWGYQTTGLFAPTSRFGTPDEFRTFIDHCHSHDIGVILDWVPAHFPRDAHGLAFFDGTHLYEHEDPRLGEHRDWGTKIFNFGRNEVRNFLISSALFWLKEYHIDGLRVDAVASMLYLDYSREAGEWVPNKFGGRENLEAIDFIRRLNEVVHAEVPGTLTIAEESTAWPMVTRPTYMGGLGFDLKWNMGWMNDTLEFFKKDPVHRRFHQNLLTFSMVYAFSENYMLPFSHDEVVHLKRSMLDKMPGDMWQKFANLRTLYAFHFTHPGKKLLFMGGEFGQWQEWSEARSLDWHLLQYDEHKQLQHFVARLNDIYHAEPALYEIDFEWQGFQWIDFSDAEFSIISFIRRSNRYEDTVVVVLNLTPIPRNGYRVGLPDPGVWRPLVNSDAVEFGGSGAGLAAGIEAEVMPWQNCGYSAPIDLPPLGALILKR